MEARRRVISCLTDRPRPVRCMKYLCLLSNKFWSNTLCEENMTVASFLKQLISAVEELEVAIGTEDDKCAVSIIRGQGTAYVKIQEAAMETDRKETEK